MRRERRRSRGKRLHERCRAELGLSLSLSRSLSRSLPPSLPRCRSLTRFAFNDEHEFLDCERSIRKKKKKKKKTTTKKQKKKKKKKKQKKQKQKKKWRHSATTKDCGRRGIHKVQELAWRCQSARRSKSAASELGGSCMRVLSLCLCGWGGVSRKRRFCFFISIRGLFWQLIVLFLFHIACFFFSCLFGCLRCAAVMLC